MVSSNIFWRDRFEFPYEDLRFPGQATDERILYVSREASVVLYMRLLMVVVAGGVMMAAASMLPGYLDQIGFTDEWLLGVLGIGLGLLFLVLGVWWVYVLWRRSIFVLTNRRLIKIINTTPWNRHNLSLSLQSIIDTGAYSKGYFQAFFRVGKFTARSGAGNRGEKYFYVENLEQYEDLKNYVDKVLHVFGREPERLENFRPFLPFLKGEARREFVKKYPQFWS